ncbi:unnamed protein product [Amoebophrya sp. A120]|nr:unnamed protein product [Amoebophrya sp. A120]|eukprot:GSA120T00007855001.1
MLASSRRKGRADRANDRRQAQRTRATTDRNSFQNNAAWQTQTQSTPDLQEQQPYLSNLALSLLYPNLLLPAQGQPEVVSAVQEEQGRRSGPSRNHHPATDLPQTSLTKAPVMMQKLPEQGESQSGSSSDQNDGNATSSTAYDTAQEDVDADPGGYIVRGPTSTTRNRSNKIKSEKMNKYKMSANDETSSDRRAASVLSPVRSRDQGRGRTSSNGVQVDRMSSTFSTSSILLEQAFVYNSDDVVRAFMELPATERDQLLQHPEHGLRIRQHMDVAGTPAGKNKKRGGFLPSEEDKILISNDEDYAGYGSLGLRVFSPRGRSDSPMAKTGNRATEEMLVQATAGMLREQGTKSDGAGRTKSRSPVPRVAHRKEVGARSSNQGNASPAPGVVGTSQRDQKDQPAALPENEKAHTGDREQQGPSQNVPGTAHRTSGNLTIERKTSLQSQQGATSQEQLPYGFLPAPAAAKANSISSRSEGRGAAAGASHLQKERRNNLGNADGQNNANDSLVAQTSPSKNEKPSTPATFAGNENPVSPDEADSKSVKEGRSAGTMTTESIVPLPGDTSDKSVYVVMKEDDLVRALTRVSSPSSTPAAVNDGIFTSSTIMIPGKNRYNALISRTTRKASTPATKGRAQTTTNLGGSRKMHSGPGAQPGRQELLRNAKASLDEDEEEKNAIPSYQEVEQQYLQRKMQPAPVVEPEFDTRVGGGSVLNLQTKPPAQPLFQAPHVPHAHVRSAATSPTPSPRAMMPSVMQKFDPSQRQGKTGAIERTLKASTATKSRAGDVAKKGSTAEELSKEAQRPGSVSESAPTRGEVLTSTGSTATKTEKPALASLMTRTTIAPRPQTQFVQAAPTMTSEMNVGSKATSSLVKSQETAVVTPSRISQQARSASTRSAPPTKRDRTSKEWRDERSASRALQGHEAPDVPLLPENYPQHLGFGLRFTRKQDLNTGGTTSSTIIGRAAGEEQSTAVLSKSTGVAFSSSLLQGKSFRTVVPDDYRNINDSIREWNLSKNVAQMQKNLPRSFTASKTTTSDGGGANYSQVDEDLVQVLSEYVQEIKNAYAAGETTSIKAGSTPAGAGDSSSGVPVVDLQPGDTEVDLDELVLANSTTAGAAGSKESTFSSRMFYFPKKRTFSNLTEKRTQDLYREKRELEEKLLKTVMRRVMMERTRAKVKQKKVEAEDHLQSDSRTIATRNLLSSRELFSRRATSSSRRPGVVERLERQKKMSNENSRSVVEDVSRRPKQRERTTYRAARDGDEQRASMNTRRKSRSSSPEEQTSSHDDLAKDYYHSPSRASRDERLTADMTVVSPKISRVLKTPHRWNSRFGVQNHRVSTGKLSTSVCPSSQKSSHKGEYNSSGRVQNYDGSLRDHLIDQYAKMRTSSKTRQNSSATDLGAFAQLSKAENTRPWSWQRVPRLSAAARNKDSADHAVDRESASAAEQRSSTPLALSDHDGFGQVLKLQHEEELRMGRSAGTSTLVEANTRTTRNMHSTSRESILAAERHSSTRRDSEQTVNNNNSMSKADLTQEPLVDRAKLTTQYSTSPPFSTKPRQSETVVPAKLSLHLPQDRDVVEIRYLDGNYPPSDDLYSEPSDMLFPSGREQEDTRTQHVLEPGTFRKEAVYAGERKRSAQESRGKTHDLEQVEHDENKKKSPTRHPSRLNSRQNTFSAPHKRSRFLSKKFDTHNELASQASLALAKHSTTEVNKSTFFRPPLVQLQPLPSTIQIPVLEDDESALEDQHNQLDDLDRDPRRTSQILADMHRKIEHLGSLVNFEEKTIKRLNTFHHSSAGSVGSLSMIWEQLDFAEDDEEGDQGENGRNGGTTKMPASRARNYRRLVQLRHSRSTADSELEAAGEDHQDDHEIVEGAHHDYTGSEEHQHHRSIPTEQHGHERPDHTHTTLSHSRASSLEHTTSQQPTVSHVPSKNGDVFDYTSEAEKRLALVGGSNRNQNHTTALSSKGNDFPSSKDQSSSKSSAGTQHERGHTTAVISSSPTHYEAHRTVPSHLVHTTAVERSLLDHSHDSHGALSGSGQRSGRASSSGRDSHSGNKKAASKTSSSKIAKEVPAPPKRSTTSQSSKESPNYTRTSSTTPIDVVKQNATAVTAAAATPKPAAISDKINGTSTASRPLQQSKGESSKELARKGSAAPGRAVHAHGINGNGVPPLPLGDMRTNYGKNKAPSTTTQGQPLLDRSVDTPQGEKHAKQKRAAATTPTPPSDISGTPRTKIKPYSEADLEEVDKILKRKVVHVGGETDVNKNLHEFEQKHHFAAVEKAKRDTVVRSSIVGRGSSSAGASTSTISTPAVQMKLLNKAPSTTAAQQAKPMQSVSAGGRSSVASSAASGRAAVTDKASNPKLPAAKTATAGRTSSSVAAPAQSPSVGVKMKAATSSATVLSKAAMTPVAGTAGKTSTSGIGSKAPAVQLPTTSQTAAQASVTPAKSIKPETTAKPPSASATSRPPSAPVGAATSAKATSVTADRSSKAASAPSKSATSAAKTAAASGTSASGKLATSSAAAKQAANSKTPAAKNGPGPPSVSRPSSAKSAVPSSAKSVQLFMTEPESDRSCSSNFTRSSSSSTTSAVVKMSSRGGPHDGPLRGDIFATYAGPTEERDQVVLVDLYGQRKNNPDDCDTEGEWSEEICESCQTMIPCSSVGCENLPTQEVDHYFEDEAQYLSDPEPRDLLPAPTALLRDDKRSRETTSSHVVVRPNIEYEQADTGFLSRIDNDWSTLGLRESAIGSRHAGPGERMTEARNKRSGMFEVVDSVLVKGDEKNCSTVSNSTKRRKSSRSPAARSRISGQYVRAPAADRDFFSS